MAITLTAPTTSPNNTIVAMLASDVDLISVSRTDFSLRRADNNAVISTSSDFTIGGVQRVGNKHTWNITVKNTTNYAGEVYIQARAEGFFEREGFARVPTSALDSNRFRFSAAPPSVPTPSTPGSFAVSAIDASSVQLTFTASTPTVTQYQYRFSTSTSSLSSASWHDAGTGTTIIVKGLPADTLLYFQVRAVNQTAFSAASGILSARTLPVAVLSIEAIDEQFIPVLTEDYELEIDIGGAPERAYVDGDMEGFYHTWDSENAKIRIKAEQVTRLITGALWNVHLVKGMKTLDAEIIYHVVPSAPVIANPGAQKLYRGYRFSLDIAIANTPTIARGGGLLTGLKYGAREDGEDGLNIAGRLPKDANLTEAAFKAAIYAENSGGSDNLGVSFDIEDIDVYGIKLFPNTALHRIRLNNPDEDVTSVASATIDVGLSLTSLSAAADYFYITTNGAAIWRVSRPLVAGGSIVLGTPWTGVGSRLIRGTAVDGSYLYVVDTRSSSSYRGIVVLDRSAPSSFYNIFGFPTEISQPRGIVVRGDSLIVLDNGDNALYWCDKNTARNQRATITKTVNLPAGEYRDIAILSDTIFITDITNDKIYEVNADLADGTTLTKFDVSYDVPSALRNLGAITVG